MPKIVELLDNDIKSVLEKHGKLRSKDLRLLVNEKRAFRHVSLGVSKNITKKQKSRVSSGTLSNYVQRLVEKGEIRKTVSTENQAVFYELSRSVEELLLANFLEHLTEFFTGLAVPEYVEVPASYSNPYVPFSVSEYVKSKLEGFSSEQLRQMLEVLEACMIAIDKHLKTR